MRMGWQAIGIAVATAGSVAMLIGDARRGDGLAWLLVAFALAIPAGAIVASIRDRKNGRLDAADTTVRMGFELALTVTVVVLIDSLRIANAAVCD